MTFRSGIDNSDSSSQLNCCQDDDEKELWSHENCFMCQVDSDNCWFTRARSMKPRMKIIEIFIKICMKSVRRSTFSMWPSTMCKIFW